MELGEAGILGELKARFVETRLTRSNRPRHPLRCQLCRHRHGPVCVLPIPETEPSGPTHVRKLTSTADEYKNDPRNPAVKNQAPNH
jgi:hypothetical protein